MYIKSGVRFSGCGPKIRATEACLKIDYRGFEVSVSFDNSCGAMHDLSRTELRVYGGKDMREDLTKHICLKNESSIHPDGLESLVWVKRRIDRAIRLGLISA